MKLIDRERVDGTEVTIGKRVIYQGSVQKFGRKYSAEYRDDAGKQVCESLGTSNRNQARRLAIEIQQRLETGAERVTESAISIDELSDRYFEMVKTKNSAPKTEWKYRADLSKLKEFCKEKQVLLARRFSADDLYRFRQWLQNKSYAAKTVEAALVLTKQVFKWAWRQAILRDYRLAAVSLPKAKAKPQPCFTTEQVESLITAAQAEEKLSFAMMAYAGLRIGEVEQLRWEDIRFCDDKPVMLHIRRGGSNGTTKDKDERFVPVHPRIGGLLPAPKKTGEVFDSIRERILLKRLKALCKSCNFTKPLQYKLHSFRHHFASLCANHGVAHRKALAWLGHSNSDMLDLYYHLHDDDSQQAMLALAAGAESLSIKPEGKNSPEGNLRANGQSKIESLSQIPEFTEFAITLADLTERGGFESPHLFQKLSFWLRQLGVKSIRFGKNCNHSA